MTRAKPYDIDEESTDFRPPTFTTYTITRTRTIENIEVKGITNPKGSVTVKTHKTETYEIEYLPDLSTKDGVKEFFNYISEGFFTAPKEIDYIRRIFIEAEHDRINFRQLFSSLKKVLADENVHPNVKLDLITRIANKIDLEKIQIGFVELMHHFIETGLIDYTNIILKLRRYLMSPGLRDSDLDVRDTLRPDDKTLEATSKRLREIAAQIKVIAEKEVKTGNVRTIDRTNRTGYTKLFKILDDARVFEFQPRLLEEIVTDWEPELFSTTNNSQSLVKAMVEYGQSYFARPVDFDFAFMLLARKTAETICVLDAYDILTSGLADALPEECVLLKAVIENYGDARIQQSLAKFPSTLPVAPTLPDAH